MAHDERGPLRIAGDRGIVWERSAEPWPAVLAAGAAAFRDLVVAVVQRAGVDPLTEVFSLMLVYVDQCGLHLTPCFGLQSDRRRWLAAGLDASDFACRLWGPEPESGPGRLYHMDADLLDSDYDAFLHREAAMRQPGDPRRIVFTAAAGLLARHDWTGLLTPTDDFVVYIAEHDELRAQACVRSRD